MSTDPHAPEDTEAYVAPEGAHDTDRPPAAMDLPTDPRVETVPEWVQDPEATVNLTGDVPYAFERDDTSMTSPAPPSDAMPAEGPDSAATAVYRLEGDASPLPGDVARAHLRGLLEALVFASDKPIKTADLARSAAAPVKDVRDLLLALKDEYAPRGVQLDEVAGGWLFRTSAAYAPFVRDLTKQKPVRLTRAQIETLAILAYRQPITRPEIDDIRGVDCGPVLKLLLERDLIRILGKKDEPGRPLLYGTTTAFLELFGLKSLKDLPTLREFTELNEDSRRVVERELGEVLETKQEDVGPGDAQDVEARDAAGLDATADDPLEGTLPPRAEGDDPAGSEGTSSEGTRGEDASEGTRGEDADEGDPGEGDRREGPIAAEDDFDAAGDDAEPFGSGAPTDAPDIGAPTDYPDDAGGEERARDTLAPLAAAGATGDADDVSPDALAGSSFRAADPSATEGVHDDGDDDMSPGREPRGG